MSLDSVHFFAASRHGGAGRAASRLEEALSQLGTQTRFSVQRPGEEKTEHIAGQFLSGRPWWLLPTLSRGLCKLSSQKSGLQSLNILPTGRLKHLNQSQCSILNLHWIGSDSLSIGEIGQIKKPFVWTLHDMWALCGTRHYESDDENASWRDSSSTKRRHIFDVDRLVFQHKLRSWQRKGWIACPSEWLSGCVRESALLNHWEVRTIPNALNTDIYAPRQREACREELKLNTHKKVILFGAQSADQDPRKGFDLVEKTMGHLGSMHNHSDLVCVVFGNNQPGPPSFGGMPAVYLGALKTDEELVRAYGAADVVMVPSRQENLPQVATEAQSCGRSVIGFRTTGMVDAVVEGKTGLLAEPFDCVQAALQLHQFLADERQQQQFESDARKRAVQEWSQKVVAQAYVNYFEEVIAHWNHP